MYGSHGKWQSNYYMEMDMTAISGECDLNAFFQGQTSKQPHETRERKKNGGKTAMERMGDGARMRNIEGS